MTEPITSFAGKHAFLSNFYPAQITHDMMVWPTVEHAYQGAKAKNPRGMMAVHGCKTAGQAKMMGRRIVIREDWDAIKLDVMLTLLRKKFAIPALRDQLIATHPRDLIEGNTWRDRFWGVYQGEGENHLGRMLMRLRNEAIFGAPPL